MARTLTATLLSVWLLGCANHGVNAEFGHIEYDYLVNSAYPLTEKHKNIFLDIDGDNLILPLFNSEMPSLEIESPEVESLEMETLKLNWVKEKQQAQIILHLRISNSFLIERPAGIRTNVVFNAAGKGHLEDVAILRGFIRTHYQVELVDVLNDHLIDHFQGAENFAIENIDLFDHQANISAMQIQFDQQARQARKVLMEKLWKNIKNYYLAMVQVSFGKEKFTLVKNQESEPRYLQAFNLLKRNNRNSANQALRIYNQGIKDYQDLEDDFNKEMKNLFDYGITVSSRISNHTHQDRYPNGQASPLGKVTKSEQTTQKSEQASP